MQVLTHYQIFLKVLRWGLEDIMQLQSVNDDSRIKSLLEKHFILTD
jgi:hypothetical protein